jgi:hypothetical protein
LYFAEDFNEMVLYLLADGSQEILIPKKKNLLWEAELSSFEAILHSEVSISEILKTRCI